MALIFVINNVNGRYYKRLNRSVKLSRRIGKPVQYLNDRLFLLCFVNSLFAFLVAHNSVHSPHNFLVFSFFLLSSRLNN